MASFEFPQDISLFLSGAWTSHIGSFLQVTYDTQGDHFSMDNTDIRYANKTKLGGKELVYGLDLNNNPTVDDLWNSTPAWGYPGSPAMSRRPRTRRHHQRSAWRRMSADSAPTPCGTTICTSTRRIYRSDHVGGPQPNTGAGVGINIRGVAPYWRVAWQQLTGEDAV